MSDDEVWCDVCMGRFGDAVCSAMFVLDSAPKMTTVRFCRDCLAAAVGAMTKQFNVACATDVADVAAICRLLGIEGAV